MFQDYENIIENMTDELTEIKKVRRKTIIKYICGWLTLIFGFPILGIFSIAAEDRFVSGILAVLLFVVVISSIVFLIRTYKRFRYDFKHIIVRAMVGHLIETCELPEAYPGRELKWNYGEKNTINSSKIARSGLFIIKKGDRFRGQDQIKGKIGLTAFNFSSLTLFKRALSFSNQNRSRHYKLKRKYQGALFLADFNKNFKGHTLLRDRKIRSFRHLKRYIWLIFNQLIHGKKLPRIYLEDKEFNQYFKTKTSDEIEARYILTSRFMEKLIHFRKKKRNPIDVSFRHSNIAIAVSSKKAFFSPSIFRRMKKGQVRDVYDDLIFFFSIIEDLNLNTRIWTKK